MMRSAALLTIMVLLASACLEAQDARWGPPPPGASRRTVLPPRAHPLAFAFNRAQGEEISGRREKLAKSIGEGVVVLISREAASDVDN